MSPNPYAPPAATPSGAPGNPRFEEHRFSVPLLILIAVVTLGLYAPFWLLRRRKLVDSLDSDRKLGIAIPGIALLLICCGSVIAFLEGLKVVDGDFGKIIARVGGVFVLVAAFRTRRILLDHTRRNGLSRDISGFGTFVFGGLYLQSKINAIADELQRTNGEYFSPHEPVASGQGDDRSDDYDKKLDEELSAMTRRQST